MSGLHTASRVTEPLLQRTTSHCCLGPLVLICGKVSPLTGMALLRKGELTIVSGAPREGFSGQVAFLKADPAAKRSLSVEFVLSGPGLASSFDYDVTVVDLNGDGNVQLGGPCRRSTRILCQRWSYRRSSLRLFKQQWKKVEGDCSNSA
ncbi:hypothetical protein Q5P01_008499 [Channa striata]|uniref:Uncharacterized protein n=1 Tax=Channa striata TaxID=64152 RepID=A0AA88N0T1_CHASR|nr:hypothetical protein Q5P01_008499 [Channa striata]